MGYRKQYKVYIVLSQTGTILSRILKVITKDDYNHASISLNKSLDTMYSFGRLNAYIPIIGGYVQESPKYGTFKRFNNSDIMLIEIEVDKGTYTKIKRTLYDMKNHKRRYRYNYIGLLLGGLGIYLKRDNVYYCSEFVRDILLDSGVITEDMDITGVVKPMELANIPDRKVIYSGKLREYSVKQLI